MFNEIRFKTLEWFKFYSLNYLEMSISSVEYIAVQHINVFLASDDN